MCLQSFKYYIAGFAVKFVHECFLSAQGAQELVVAEARNPHPVSDQEDHKPLQSQRGDGG